VVAVSELGNGSLDLTLSYWDSVVAEADAQRALDCLQSVLGSMGHDNTVTCGDFLKMLG
jgi:hypothetical protein